MKDKLSDLRNHLFAALEALRDPEAPMDIDRAKAISQVAQTVINSAKVELQAMDMAGRFDSEFLGIRAEEPPRKSLPVKANG